ncbi:MAG: type II toxin-antitoxin system RelE/ParE family toxin [Spirochaetaceae bacterium]|jgi:plasmid stabilization system protein ParE|nr:type II toxin-antitoxin system RelE/ParE family toxin [Spirochaetaceae bacterium]
MPEEYGVVITGPAEADIAGIVDYIALDDVVIAKRILKRLKAKIDSLAAFPGKGHYPPELLAFNIKDYREVTEKPWRIIYKISAAEVHILAVIDSRRNVQEVLIEKLLDGQNFS